VTEKNTDLVALEYGPSVGGAVLLGNGKPVGIGIVGEHDVLIFCKSYDERSEAMSEVTSGRLLVLYEGGM
jgi:hypothetical protein